MLDFDQEEVIRYSRHFPVIGIEGQKKLQRARILCVGAGGLGCPALQYLAASGIGTIGIMDDDHVELSNLQRQVLFTEHDIGRKKVTVIAERLAAMNHHLIINVHVHFFSTAHQGIIQDYDVILDATDNYEARYLLNAVCRRFKKPLISASIYQYDAQISVFNYLQGPCYQCLYPEPPAKEYIPNCSVAGVLGVLPGVAGTIQATEAIKVILGLDGILSGKLLCLNLLSMRFNQFIITKQDCTKHPLIEYGDKEIDLQNAFLSISPIELDSLLTASQDGMQLVDVREPYERAICHIGGVLIPLSQLESSLTQLNKYKRVIIYCKTGVRSLQAHRIFLNAGFEQVHYLEGGILNWQAMVDPNLKRY